jgi:hypothetical protein
MELPVELESIHWIGPRCMRVSENLENRFSCSAFMLNLQHARLIFPIRPIFPSMPITVEIQYRNFIIQLVPYVVFQRIKEPSMVVLLRSGVCHDDDAIDILRDVLFYTDAFVSPSRERLLGDGVSIRPERPPVGVSVRGLLGYSVLKGVDDGIALPPCITRPG